jgi:L-lactate dehydrogenase complex protein LldE
MRVALFITCFNDLLFPDVGKATVGILERLGVEVDVPASQTCCGQIHFNTGYRDECVPMVRRFASTFSDAEAIVTPSASCAAMIRHHHPTIAADAGEASLETAVAETAGRVYELTEFLVDVLGITDVGARFPHTVAFHPTCHSLRLLRIGDRPQRLLAAVDGLTLVPIEGADECCGFGGTFSVKNEATSVAMGMDKVDRIVAGGAEVLTAADTSCLMHLGGLLSRRKASTRVLHVAEILAGDRRSG